jgi:hypothetical protein
MRPIALARIRLSGTAQNICGISAQTFAVKDGAPAEDQLVGWVDHLTLLDNCVLVEREGKADELICLTNVAAMRPTADLKKELLGSEEAHKRAAEAEEREAHRLALEKAQAERQRLREEQKKRPAVPPVAVMRDDDGDILRPEAAITFVPPPVADDAPKRKPGRPRKLA